MYNIPMYILYILYFVCKIYGVYYKDRQSGHEWDSYNPFLSLFKGLISISFHLYCPFFFLSFLRGRKRKDDKIVLQKASDSLFKDYIYSLSHFVSNQCKHSRPGYQWETKQKIPGLSLYMLVLLCTLSLYNRYRDI